MTRPVSLVIIYYNYLTSILFYLSILTSLSDTFRYSAAFLQQLPAASPMITCLSTNYYLFFYLTASNVMMATSTSSDNTSPWWLDWPSSVPSICNTSVSICRAEGNTLKCRGLLYMYFLARLPMLSSSPYNPRYFTPDTYP